MDPRLARHEWQHNRWNTCGKWHSPVSIGSIHEPANVNESLELAQQRRVRGVRPGGLTPFWPVSWSPRGGAACNWLMRRDRMSESYRIVWADGLWDPVRGCSRKSAACVNCYAEAATAQNSQSGGWGEGFATLEGRGERLGHEPHRHGRAFEVHHDGAHRFTHRRIGPDRLQKDACRLLAPFVPPPARSYAGWVAWLAAAMRAAICWSASARSERPTRS